MYIDMYKHRCINTYKDTYIDTWTYTYRDTRASMGRSDLPKVREGELEVPKDFNLQITDSTNHKIISWRNLPSLLLLLSKPVLEKFSQICYNYQFFDIIWASLAYSFKPLKYSWLNTLFVITDWNSQVT